MPAVQTTYGMTHARWVEGMILNSEPHVIVTGIAEDVEGIGFGKVCVQGSVDQAVTDAEVGAKFVGIAVMDTTKPNDTYAQYDNVNVMRKGVIVVMASVAVAKEDPVYFVPATGVLTNVVGGGNTLIADATWDTATAGAGLAALRLA